MRLLVVDILRRQHRWLTPVLLLFLAGEWWWAAGQGTDATAFGVSMGVAFVIGPLSIPSLTPRAIWYLPVSRRDIWRAHWLVATVGATALTTIAKLAAAPALLFGSTLDISSFALSTAYDFAYTGLACGLMVSFSPAGTPRRGFWTLIQSLVAIAVVGGMFWGYAISGMLPTRWSDMSAGGAAILVAALGLAVAAAFHVPKSIASPIRPGISPRPRGAPRTRFGLLDGLTGLPQLFLHEYTFSILMGISLSATFAGVMYVTDGIIPTPGDRFRDMQRLLIFDGTIAQWTGHPFDVLIWVGFFAATLATRFPEMLRHLRTLPLSGTQLNAILVAWPALIWLTVWGGLLIVHYVVVRQPVASLQGSLFVSLVGLSGLTHALTLRFPGASKSTFALAVSAAPLIRMVSGTPSSLLLVLGLAGMAAAAVLNRDALLRSTCYRNRTPPPGAPARMSA
jgi:hypothetical protein